ncbi:MAG TPA: hypothetical protein EYG40_14360 [Verrucomicrobia bacterium]|nr:hypothetical protein [Verrucomicrobiales bacterium]HIL56205.1 hypothetical protein [Verrucomicrobiota bacterium]
MNPFVLPASCTLFILLRFLFHHDLIINLWILVFVIDAIIIGLGLLSIIQLIITIKKKRNRFAGICLGVLLTIGSISYGTDFIKDLGLKLRFYRLKSAYSEIVANVKSETGPQKGNHLGIYYRSEIDPVFRVTFPWSGIVDNWYGIIYDPSGKVLRCNESDPRFPGPGPEAPEDKELSQIRMVFGGLLYKAEHLGNHWYLCWFT